MLEHCLVQAIIVPQIIGIVMEVTEDRQLIVPLREVHHAAQLITIVIHVALQFPQTKVADTGLGTVTTLITE